MLRAVDNDRAPDLGPREGDMVAVLATFGGILLLTFGLFAGLVAFLSWTGDRWVIGAGQDSLANRGIQRLPKSREEEDDP